MALEQKEMELVAAKETMDRMQQKNHEDRDARERAVQLERSATADREKMQAQLEIAMREAKVAREAAAVSEKAMLQSFEAFMDEKQQLQKSLEVPPHPSSRGSSLRCDLRPDQMICSTGGYKEGGSD